MAAYSRRCDLRGLPELVCDHVQRILYPAGCASSCPDRTRGRVRIQGQGGFRPVEEDLGHRHFHRQPPAAVPAGCGLLGSPEGTAD
ncbi:hypothetical protein D3C72_2189540 [compost metagenome]